MICKVSLALAACVAMTLVAIPAMADEFDLSHVPRSELSRAMYETKRAHAPLPESCISFGIKVLNIAGHEQYSIYDKDAKQVALQVNVDLRNYNRANVDTKLAHFLDEWIEGCINELTDPVEEVPVAEEPVAEEPHVDSLAEENAKLKSALVAIHDIVHALEQSVNLGTDEQDSSEAHEGNPETEAHVEAAAQEPQDDSEDDAQEPDDIADDAQEPDDIADDAQEPEDDSVNDALEAETIKEKALDEAEADDNDDETQSDLTEELGDDDDQDDDEE